MKLVNFYRRPISLFVMISFAILLCFWANPSPAAPATGNGSAPTMEKSEGASPGFVEQEETEPVVKKGKKFPWLIVGAVVVIGAAAVYFLVIKKPKYTLTTTVGEGCTGTPAASAVQYKKGTAVAYNYSPQSGYGNLQVKLDGVAVPAAGTVTMDKDHALDVTAVAQFTLTVNLGAGTSGTPAATTTYNKDTVVNYSYTTLAGYSSLNVKLDGITVAASGSITMDRAHSIETSAIHGSTVNVTSNPSGVKIFVNNVDSGKVTPASFNYTAAGSYTYLLRQCGYQDFSKTQNVVLGQTYNINANLIPGIMDNFNALSTCWSPYLPANWSVSGGIYKCRTSTQDWNFSYYDTIFDMTSYTLEVKVKKVDGDSNYSVGILLTDTTDMTSIHGYLFNYTANGSWSIWNERNVDWIADEGGSSTAIKTWSDSARINKGNSWNIVKIVRSGSNYSYYINGFLMASFNDSSSDPRVVVLTPYVGGKLTEIQYDYVKLTGGAAMGPMFPDTQSVALPLAGQDHRKTR